MSIRMRRSLVMWVATFMTMIFFMIVTPTKAYATEATTPEDNEATITSNEATETTDSESDELIPFVPLYFQQDYPKTPYGGYGTVSSHGCGITSVAMVFSYLLDEYIMPDTLAKEFGRYNTEVGSSWTLFPDSAEKYGLTTTQTWKWDEVVEALENGHIVIANPHECLFTGGGHFIVLYGITNDGRILVNDPNKYNYFMFNEGCNPALTEGFLSGFDQKYFNPECLPCWIYPLKDLEAVELRKQEKALEEYIANQEKALEEYLAGLTQ